MDTKFLYKFCKYKIGDWKIADYVGAYVVDFYNEKKRWLRITNFRAAKSVSRVFQRSFMRRLPIIRYDR